MITAEVVLDSVRVPEVLGQRITTLQLRYPRFFHEEFLTHRAFSRNASSSRAIPVAKMIAMVESQPGMPIHWGKNEKGMQAHEEVDEPTKILAASMWNMAAKNACDTAKGMMSLGLHKQVANRILQPFQHISVVVTSTEWENFYELRDHEDADPNFHMLARAIRAARDGSQPQHLKYGEWHLPYVSGEEAHNIGLGVAIKCSSARCGRVSYLTHEGKVPVVAEDVKLFERLVGSKPLHASPTEHQAAAMSSGHLRGNFSSGWVQHRKLLEDGVEPEVYTMSHGGPKL